MEEKKYSLWEIFFSFLKLGAGAFGGPAMVAYIKDLSVRQKKWIKEGEFKEGVAIAQAVPGATALQVATYVGLKLRGILGGLCSFLGFVLPAFLLILVLSWVYTTHQHLPQVAQIFKALRVAVVAIVAKAFFDFFLPISRKVKEVSIAFLAFILFSLGVNPFLIIFTCFLFSLLIFKDKGIASQEDLFIINWKRIFLLSLFPFCCLGILYIFFPKYFNLSFVMMKVDAFAFGGGYASLPLMLSEVVDKYGWMSKTVFMDGIALGQITPGPIIITATFVGFYTLGIIGAIVATISIFTPSFVIISIASELQSKIRHSVWFVRAKRGLIASFSGLLLFAELKFIGGIDWNLFKIIFASALTLALLKRVNILWIVAFTVILSFFVPF